MRAALAEDPDIVEAHMLLGNVYKKMKRPADAIAAYRDALARDDEHQNALFSLALAYKDEGRFDEARVGFERARELDPRNGKVLWQLADLWMRQGDTARAEAIVTDALAQQVDEPRFLLKLGEICIEAKRFDEAEQALRRALEKKPALVLAHYDLGLVHEGKGQIEQAMASGDMGALDQLRGQLESAMGGPQGLAALQQQLGPMLEQMGGMPGLEGADLSAMSTMDPDELMALLRGDD